MPRTVPFPVLKNDLVLRAATGRPTERTPVWVMRQAGRYLPEFQEMRKQHDFFTLCQTPELACQITLQPVNRFQVDAAIIFSDILVIPQALGMTVNMVPGVGPSFPTPLVEPPDIMELKGDINLQEKLGYMFEAITLTRHRLEGKVPLIGFCGGPWTLMGYMIEGGGSQTMSKAKKWLYQWPHHSHDLLGLITGITVEFLIAQVKAGAQMLQVFETSASFLSPVQFREFALPYLQVIRYGVRKGLEFDGLDLVPMVVFAKGAHHSLEELSKLGYDVISVDWTVSPQMARTTTGSGVTLQGNLDPCALYSSFSDIDKLVSKMVEEFGIRRYIANLGHGIYPDTKPGAMETFVDAVHKHSACLNE